MKMKLFIGSSKESIRFAHGLRTNLKDVFEVTVWENDVFKPAETPMESLMYQASNSDFAVFVCNNDDITTSREQTSPSIRDNIIFELGLFSGKLGRKNVIFLLPDIPIKPKILSDLAGITYLTYEANRKDNNYVAATSSAAVSIEEQFSIVVKSSNYRHLRTYRNLFQKVLNDKECIHEEKNRDIYNYVFCLSKYLFSNPHIYDYSLDIQLSPAEISDCLIYENIISYQINLDHLGVCEYDFPFKYVCEFSTQDDSIMEKLPGMFEFDLCIGNTTITKRDVQITSEKEKYFTRIIISIEKQIKIKNSDCVKLQSRTLINKDDHNIANRVRFPTWGYFVKLAYSKNFLYEYSWYKTILNNPLKIPYNDNFPITENGINAKAFSWLFPGEGINILWLPKKEIKI